MLERARFFLAKARANDVFIKLGYVAEYSISIAGKFAIRSPQTNYHTLRHLALHEDLKIAMMCQLADPVIKHIPATFIHTNESTLAYCS